MSAQMEKRLYVIAIVAILALVVVNALSIYVSLGRSQVVLSQDQQRNVVIVSGTGTVTAKPDQAVIYLGVQTRATTAAEAIRQNAERMIQVIEAMLKLGIPKDKMETASFTLAPVVFCPDREKAPPQIVGYMCRNQIRVTMTEVYEAGRAIDSAIAAGANSVDTVFFALSEKIVKEIQGEAIKLAVGDADRKARELATALGVQIVGPMRISIGPSYEPHPYRLEAKLETPIMPREIQVTVNVDATYLFK